MTPEKQLSFANVFKIDTYSAFGKEPFAIIL